MGNQIKFSRTSKVIFLSLAGSLTMITSIAFAMLASRYLSKHDYATIRQTFLVYEILAPLMMLGLPNALYYFLPRAGDDVRGVVIDNTFLLLCSGFLFTLFIIMGGYSILAERFDNIDLNTTLPWMAVYPLLIMPIASMTALLVFTERVRTLAIYGILTNIIMFVTGIIAVLATRSFEAPVLVRLAVPAILLPVALVLMFKTLPGNWRMPRVASMTRMVRYAVPLGFATMLGTLTMQLHAIVVASLCTTEEFAMYINGAFEIPIIGIITGSITSIIFSEMSDKCSNGEKSQALELFKKASIKSACFIFPSFLYFLVVAEPFIVLIFSEQYRDSRWPFMVYLLVLPARIVVYGAAMMALGLTREILFRSIFDLILNTLLCIFLVNYFGYNAAPFALVITLYIWTIPYNINKLAVGFNVKWINILPWKKLFEIFIISMPATLISLIILELIPSSYIVVRLITTGVVYLLVTGFMLSRAGFFSLNIIYKNLLG
jgi:O-antigen/teichoic acid export membrane protein